MNRIFLVIAALLVLIVTVISFMAVKSVPSAEVFSGKLDKAEIIYERAISYYNESQYDKAASALFVVINKYPDSGYAEKALRKLAALYYSKGDYGKSGYYYNRLLKTYPDISDAAQIRQILEDMNLKMMTSKSMTEDSIEYVVQPGDSLFAIARRFNTTVGLIKKVNGLSSDVIRPGQKLKVVVSKFSIFVDKAKNILILNKDGEIFKTYTVSTGKNNSTPVGVFKVEEKMVKPVWYTVGAVVSPDSKEYELGTRWIGISVEGYGIHGTSDESTIGSQVTQGCVRMYNADVEELFDIVPSGTEVEIVDGKAPLVGTKQ